MNSLVTVTSEPGSGLASRLRAELTAATNRIKQNGESLPSPPPDQPPQLAQAVERAAHSGGRIVDLKI